MGPTVHSKNRRHSKAGTETQKKGLESGERSLGASKEGKELIFMKDLHIYHLAYTISFNPLSGTIPTSQVRKLRLRIIKYPAQDHTVSSSAEVQTQVCVSSQSELFRIVHTGDQVGMIWSTPMSPNPSGVPGESLSRASVQRHLKASSLWGDGDRPNV